MRPRHRPFPGLLLALIAAGSVSSGAPAATAQEVVAVRIEAPQATSVEGALRSLDAKAEAASPQAPRSPGALKAKAAREIAKRQQTLAELGRELATARRDCGFNASALARVTATQTGLSNLGSQIAATADVNQARSLYPQIFSHWRVYLVVQPMVRTVLACGRHLERIDRQQATAIALDAEIAAAKARGVDTAAAEAALAATRGAWPAAQGAATAAAGSTVGLSPDYGVEAVKQGNRAAFHAAKQQLRTADQLLDDAARQLERARKDLRSATRRDDRLDRRAARQASQDSRPGRGKGRG